jgi:hypothetical protein
MTGRAVAKNQEVRVFEGPIYYLPLKRVLVQVRYGGEIYEGRITTTEACKYWTDATTCSKTETHQADDRNGWVLIDNPENFPQYFVRDKTGWRVIKKNIFDS